MIEDFEAENIKDIDDLIMKIVTEDPPNLDLYEWTMITQALEEYRESFKKNG